MHPRGWCTYASCRVPGERARSHRQRRVVRIYRSTILHERIKQQEQHKPNESHQRQKQHSQRALVRPAASGSVKEKVVLQTTRTSTYRIILMPEKSAIESMMPQGRSPEAKKGGRGVQ